MINAFKILIGQLEGKRPLGRPTHMQEGSIRMYIMKQSFRDGLDSFGSALAAVPGSCNDYNECLSPVHVLIF
jgi:hypothetical protein